MTNIIWECWKNYKKVGKNNLAKGVIFDEENHRRLVRRINTYKAFLGICQEGRINAYRLPDANSSRRQSI